MLESQDGRPEATGNPSRPEPAHGFRRHVVRVVAILAAFFVVILGAGVAWAYSLPMPKPHPTPQATIVYGQDGQVIGRFSEQNRVDVNLDQVPQVLVDAVVSTEDRHFFSEGAVNPVSTARAFFADVSGSHGLQGGSTITQQYVKQAYLTPQRSLSRKMKGGRDRLSTGPVAVQAPDTPGVSEHYLLGPWCLCVQAASQAFFAKNVQQLGLAEASLLAAIIKDPGGADPAYDPTLARRFQTETLNAMVRDKRITRARADAVSALPYPTYVVPPASAGSTTSTAAGSDYFLAAVRAQLYQAYGREIVDGGGLRVYTTLDPTLQTEAYNSVYGPARQALDPARGDPSGAVVTMDDAGHVLALVGGQNYGRSSVDLALGAAGGGSGRQAGSTFKAIMLASVIQQGYSVQSVIPAPSHITIPGGSGYGPWSVTNYEGEAPAPALSLVDATTLSINTVYAQVVAKLGADKLDAMAEAMGIPKSAFPNPYPSQVLGTADVSPLDMTTAFSTLAAGGTYHSPVFVTKVTNASGRPLALPGGAPRSHQVLTPAQATIEDYVLQQVVTRGTGTAAGGIGSAVAGKTGTTENSGDGWFIGYTPQITTAVWMGYADSARSMDGFRGLSSVTGGTIPAQLWHDYMAAAVKSHPQYAGTFPAPGSLAGKNLMAPAATPASPVPSAPTSAGPAPTTVAPAPTSTTSPTEPPALPQPPPTEPATTIGTTVPSPVTTTTVGG